MFHAATAVLLERGIERSSHHGILSAFGQYIVKTGLVEPKFHTYLRKTFALRNECDYLSFTSAKEEQAKITLERTKEFIEVCRKLCQ
ncbi:MAG: HEPN domain-containing protein [Sedimentisphaerales bacterium]